MYLASPGNCSNDRTLSPVTPASLYANAWIKENTKKDLIYMISLFDSGIMMDWQKKEKINREIRETSVKDNAECNALL